MVCGATLYIFRIQSDEWKDVPPYSPNENTPPGPMAHAWVEVKLPGYGWIPVDITLEDGFMNTNYYLDVATEKGPGYLYKNVTMDWSSYFYDGFTFSWDGQEAPDTEQNFVFKIKDFQ